MLARPDGVHREQVRAADPLIRRYLGQLGDLMLANPIFKARLTNVGVLNLSGCMALAVTGPADVLEAAQAAK